jgi:hypothetical protein
LVASLALVQEAQRAWSDPDKRTQIVGLHAQGASLLEMVAALGLEGHLDPSLRASIEGLSDAAVQAIRDVFVAEAAAETTGGSFFPVDCRVATPGGPVTVTKIEQMGSGPIVQIT